MKPYKILFLALLCAFNSSAQTFNKQYSSTHNVFTDTRTPAVDRPNKHIFSSGYDDNINELVIIRTDLDGNYQAYVALQNVSFADHDIIVTYDGGVLLAARTGDFLYVVKFKTNMTVDWSKAYSVAPIATPYDNNSVAIVKYSTGENTEDYYISCVGINHYPSTHPYDVGFDILQIDQLGDLVKHANYYPKLSVRDDLYNDGVEVNRDYVNSLAILNGDIAVAGYTEEKGTDGGKFQPWVMSIDLNLGINRQFKTVDVSALYVTDVKVIYSTDVLTYPILGCSFTDIDANLRHRIGFLTYEQHSNSTGGFIPVTGSGKKLAIENETYAKSISVNSNNDFIIGHFITGDNHTFPGLVELSKSSYAPLNIARYTIQTEHGLLGNHVTDDIYNYQLNLYNYSSGSAPKLQLIKTAANLSVDCGREDELYDETSYTPTTVQLNHNITLPDEETVYDVSLVTKTIYEDVCDEQNPDYRRAPAMNTDQGYFASVVPTAISQGEDVNCNINLETVSAVNIMVYNSLGQLVYSEKTSMAQGANVFKLPGWRLQGGLNLVKITANGKLLTTAKVMKM